ncbi:MAG: hypothetical protein JNM79_05130 [Burkholderiales bacterium]|nr:hypothetical protein [Burkholderiales bacterium]
MPSSVPSPARPASRLMRYAPFLGMGPDFVAMPLKVAAAKRIERGFLGVSAILVLIMGAWLAPYWAFRIALIVGGFYLALCAALVGGMKTADGDKPAGAWSLLAYVGILFAIGSVLWNHWLTRQEVLYWRYTMTRPAELADIQFDFAAAPVRFNEPIAKKLFEGMALRCMLYTPDEAQITLGANGCYLWTRTFNGRPGRMTDFIFDRDTLVAVRVALPFWSNAGTHAALVERYGPPAKPLNLGEALAALGYGSRALVPLLRPSISAWYLPTGVLMMDERFAWAYPHGLVYWISRDTYCSPASPVRHGKSRDPYCAQASK